jgi:hypothetical protein
MNKPLIALALVAIIMAGCVSYTVDNLANDVQGTLFGKKAYRTPMPPTPEPTATPVPTPTPVLTPLPTPAPHEIPGVIGTDTVLIVNAGFNPRAIWVKAGTKVTWQNQDGRLHDIKSDAGSSEEFDSHNLGGGQSWSRAFNTAGKFEYHDGVGIAGNGIVYVEA